MPISDLRDGFFYPILTLMIDSYNSAEEGLQKIFIQDSNTDRQWLNSVIYWLINHCTDWHDDIRVCDLSTFND